MRIRRVAYTFLASSIVCVASYAQPHFLTLPFVDPEVEISDGWIYEKPGLFFCEEVGNRCHKGIDYSHRTGSTFNVVAAGPGLAIASFSDTYGYFVFIRHSEVDSTGARYFTLYAHIAQDTWTVPFRNLNLLKSDISSSDFSEWEEVERGNLIAQAGQTGIGQGIHLHFEAQVGGYALKKIDPYDIYSTSVAYPEPCGQTHLWTECPPFLLSGLAQRDKSALTAAQMTTGKWAVQTLGSCHTGVLSGITVNMRFNNPVNGVIALVFCENTSPTASEFCGIFDVDLVQTRAIGLRQERGQVLPNTQVDYFFDFDLAVGGEGPLTLRPDRWYAFGINCTGQAGTCQIGGAASPDAYPEGRLIVDIDPGRGVGSIDAFVKDAYFLSELAPGGAGDPCPSTLILKTDRPNALGAGGITIAQAPAVRYTVQSAVGELLTSDRTFDRDYEVHDIRLWLGMFENPTCAETLVRIKEGGQVIASSAARTVCNFGTINNATAFPFPDGTVVHAGRTYQFVVETTSGSGLLRASSSLFPPSSSVYFEVFGAPVF